jgi:large subunit ribosomal protein L14e
MIPAIEVGRVCIKTAGREAGQKCVIVEIIDEKFVEVVGCSLKNRRCNIKHLEPTTQSLELKSDDAEEIAKQLEAEA